MVVTSSGSLHGTKERAALFMVAMSCRERNRILVRDCLLSSQHALLPSRPAVISVEHFRDQCNNTGTQFPQHTLSASLKEPELADWPMIKTQREHSSSRGAQERNAQTH